MIADRAIKARAKASADRIKADISNAKVIKAHQIEENDLMHLAESEELSMESLPDENISVPLSFWLANKTALMACEGAIAVQVAADETVEDLANDLSDIDMVVLPFVNFVDGRSYSHASKLRSRYNFVGEIRAVGDVHFDHLGFLARCGCDAFELPDGDDHLSALKAFSEFSDAYQPAADGGRLIFARRRKVH